MVYTERFYRRSMGKRFKSFILRRGETDLWIGVDKKSFSKDFVKIVDREVRDARDDITKYALRHPEFYTSLLPLPYDPDAPKTVRHMLKAGLEANVGPMAAVAGAIAQRVGYLLIEAGAKEVVVENGGDIFLKVELPITVEIFSGKSPLNGKVVLKIEGDETPCGVCTSSATIGHSLSFGAADAVTVIFKDAAIADSLATRCCNEVRTKDDVKKVLKRFQGGPGGIVVIIKDVLGSAGENVHFVGR